MSQMPRALIAADWVLRIFGLCFLVGGSTAITSAASPVAAIIAWIVTAGFVALTVYRWRHFRTWRKDAPSDSQVKYARKLGINFSENATKGELSDLIDAEVKRRFHDPYDEANEKERLRTQATKEKRAEKKKEGG